MIIIVMEFHMKVCKKVIYTRRVLYIQNNDSLEIVSGIRWKHNDISSFKRDMLINDLKLKF